MPEGSPKQQPSLTSAVTAEKQWIVKQAQWQLSQAGFLKNSWRVCYGSTGSGADDAILVLWDLENEDWITRCST